MTEPATPLSFEQKSALLAALSQQLADATISAREKKKLLKSSSSSAKTSCLATARRRQQCSPDRRNVVAARHLPLSGAGKLRRVLRVAICSRSAG
jgi:hypothetical protein